MPIDPQRLARVRAHFLAAAALVTAGCGGSSVPEHTINERAPDTAPPPTAAPSNEPVHINQPATEAPTAAPSKPPPGAR